MVRRTVCALAVLTAALTGCSSTDDAAGPAPSSSAPASASMSEAQGSPSSDPSPILPPPDQPTQEMTPEANFLDALPGADIPVRNNEAVFGTGQRICRALASGGSEADAAKIGVDEQRWTEEQAKTAVSIAQKTMCVDGN